MWRFVLLVLALVLCHTGNSLGTVAAAPPTQNDSLHGQEETLVGLDVYVSGSPSASAAIIMLSDVFGWKELLFRKLADKVAASGYYVVAPDYFYGDSILDIADLPVWILRHPPAAAVEITNQMVNALEAKGIHSIGLAGFCWGAKVAILVGKRKDHVKAIVQIHPSFTNASDYAEVAVPLSILAAPADGIDQYKGLLKMRRKELKLYVKIFTQVQHGWTTHYNETDKKAVKKANRAHMLMLKWFHKFL